MNVERVETRETFRVVRGVRDSAGEIDHAYFDALCDTTDEATAMHNLHLSRAAAAQAEPHVAVDGGAP